MLSAGLTTHWYVARDVRHKAVNKFIIHQQTKYKHFLIFKNASDIKLYYFSTSDRCRFALHMHRIRINSRKLISISSQFNKWREQNLWLFDIVGFSVSLRCVRTRLVVKFFMTCMIYYIINGLSSLSLPLFFHCMYINPLHTGDSVNTVGNSW